MDMLFWNEKLFTDFDRLLFNRWVLYKIDIKCLWRKSKWTCFSSIYIETLYTERNFNHQQKIIFILISSTKLLYRFWFPCQKVHVHFEKHWRKKEKHWRKKTLPIASIEGDILKFAAKSIWRIMALPGSMSKFSSTKMIDILFL